MDDHAPFLDAASAPQGPGREHPSVTRHRRLWRMRAGWWLALCVGVGGMLWLLGPMLMPFAVGVAMGYVLDPIVSRLEERGLPRALAAAVMVLALVAVLLAALVLLVPPIAAEVAALIRSLPDLHDRAQTFVADRVPGFGPGAGNAAVSDLFARIGETLTGSAGTLFGGLVSGVNGLMRAAVFWMVMPVVAFYLLIDWPRLLAAVDALLPRAHTARVRALGRDIDAALAGYLRGVVTVCVILAVYYAIALSAAGLTYGLLVGVVAGVISFVPYLGAFVGGALVVGLALLQMWDMPLALGAVVGIWVFGQFIESQILVPRLVGSSVNLHPVWLIFAVMAFGSLFGLVGAIVAVPLAAVMGVLVRFAVEEYRASGIYGSSATMS